MRCRTKYIGGVLGRAFRSKGWAGVTLPIPFYGALVLIWTTPSELGNILEVRHEVLGHVPQVERLGALRYIVTILWQYVLYGHDKAPLEIEARRLAGQGGETE